MALDSDVRKLCLDLQESNRLNTVYKNYIEQLEINNNHIMSFIKKYNDTYEYCRDGNKDIPHNDLHFFKILAMKILDEQKLIE